MYEKRSHEPGDRGLARGNAWVHHDLLSASRRLYCLQMMTLAAMDDKILMIAIGHPQPLY